MYDIVIIGAGLAGSGIAAALAGRGWDVLLLERHKLPHHKVCGEFLSPEAQGSLRALGLHSTVAALQPAEMMQARLFSRGGIAMRVDLPGVAWGVSRFALDAALAYAAEQRGAEIRTGVAATALRPLDAGHAISLRDAHGQVTEVHSRAVVVACGRHALPGLRPAVPQSPARQTYVGVKCHYEGLRLAPEVQLYLFDGGYVGLNMIEGGRTNVCMLVTQAAFKRAGSSVRGSIQRAAELNPAFGQALAEGRTLSATEVAVAPVDTERATTLWDYCARLGDAAVMIPPLCGDGMAMALRAAEICAPLADDFLRGERSLDAWQEAYCASWHREFDRPLRTGRRLQALLSVPLLGGALLGLGALLPQLSARMVQATRGMREA